MQTSTLPYGSTTDVVAYAETAERVEFIKRTYTHLAGAIGVFALIEWALFQIPGIESRVFGLLAATNYSWLIVLGAFMLVSHIANKWALSDVSQGQQYLGLGLFVVAEALIFLPLLLIANSMVPGGELILQAGIITAALFLGLTLIAFTTRKDFSFLGGILKIGFFVAIGVIVMSIIFGFNLGLLFSSIMAVLAAGSILHSTSAMMFHYSTRQHVAASLSLFASVALLFWYILRIVMALRR